AFVRRQQPRRRRNRVVGSRTCCARQCRAVVGLRARGHGVRGCVPVASPRRVANGRVRRGALVSLVVAERGLLALLASYASLGVARSFWLLAHGTVPDWLLPVAASIGLAVALLPRPARLPPSPPTP